MQFKFVKVVKEHEIEKLVGSELWGKYLMHKHLEPSNDSYLRFYTSDRDLSNPLHDKLPEIRKVMDLPDEEYTFFLVHYSW